MEKEIDIAESKRIEDMWAQVAEAQDNHNKKAKRNNERILTALQNMHGKAFIKNLLFLFEECEVGSQMGFIDEFQIVKCYSGTYVNEKFGSKIKGYWVDQWSVGDSGDSFEGYIFVKVTQDKFIKVRYSC